MAVPSLQEIKAKSNYISSSKKNSLNCHCYGQNEVSFLIALTSHGFKLGCPFTPNHIRGHQEILTKVSYIIKVQFNSRLLSLITRSECSNEHDF